MKTFLFVSASEEKSAGSIKRAARTRKASLNGSKSALRTVFYFILSLEGLLLCDLLRKLPAPSLCSPLLAFPFCCQVQLQKRPPWARAKRALKSDGQGHSFTLHYTHGIWALLRRWGTLHHCESDVIVSLSLYCSFTFLFLTKTSYRCNVRWNGNFLPGE